MRSLMFVMCASLPLMFGATNFTVNNADLVLVSGPGPVQVVNATQIYANASEDGSPWSALFSRNAGQQNITLSAQTGGTYQLQVWSIPSDSSNPQREVSTGSVSIDVEGLGPFNVTDLLNLLSAWGICPVGDPCTYDLNDDGVINVSDLLILLSHWSPKG